MLTYVATTQFKKDFKKMVKQRKDMNKLHAAVRTILSQQPLEAKYRDHALTGNLKGRRECHLSPDWLLMYVIRDGQAIFERTGSHSELFS